MTDRTKVIKGLEEHANLRTDCEDCPYNGQLFCHCMLMEDALKVLKEQEALPIVYETNKYTGLPVAHCPSCGEYLVQFHSGVDGKESRFCYYCGQEVKWDD